MNNLYIAAAVVVSYIGAHLGSFYKGPVSDPAAVSVTVQPQWRVGGDPAGFQRDGQDITVTLTDGSKITVDDRNSNFKVDIGEKVSGDTTGVPINRILKAIKGDMR